MKVLLILGLAFATLVSFASHAARTKEPQEGLTGKQKATDLEVSLAADKRKYKRHERIKLEVLLINDNGVKDIFVYGTLEFGYRASLTLYRRDAKGKEVPTRFIDDASELPPEPNDRSAFVKLLPNHFLGTYYNSSIEHLNLERPGRYSMWVEYHCPISTADVELKPFWGKETGTIRSNVLSIEVVR
jgi:hypothetical protein